MNLVLVLNCDYTPLSITTPKRGFILVDKGKAEIVRADENPITTSYKTYLRPLIIRLLNYIRYHNKKLKINRNRIFKRDNYQCVYCGSRKELTLDHVIPKSRGGTNNWENLVTSCSRCNVKKADRTPEEAKMKMLHKPFEPNLISENKIIQKIWDDFTNSFVSFQ